MDTTLVSNGYQKYDVRIITFLFSVVGHYYDVRYELRGKIVCRIVLSVHVLMGLIISKIY